MCDRILFNANVITMDSSLPRAELIAIRRNQIASVGDNGILGELKRPGVETVDCKGKTILPGFVDAHCHVFAYGESLVSLNFSRRESVHSILDIQSKIRNFCDTVPPGTWVRGKAFNEFAISEERFLNRWDLDSVAPLHPIKITHRSGHAHILNSLALARAGITEETGDPPEGLIDRDRQTGKPTGILYGMGSYLARKIPFLDEVEMKRGLELANKKLISYGITSIQDASSTNDRHQWRRFGVLKSREILQPRLTMLMGWKGFVESRREPFRTHLDSIDLRLGGVKVIVDQVTGSLNPDQQELDKQVSEINEAELQAIIHAVEPPEIEAACSAIALALKKIPRPDHRHRIEHCSVCPPKLLRKLARLGIAIVTQPSFIYYSGDRYLKAVPSDQLKDLYPVGSILWSESAPQLRD
jgi:predicted amidohydrolase YtcJ